MTKLCFIQFDLANNVYLFAHGNSTRFKCCIPAQTKILTVNGAAYTETEGGVAAADAESDTLVVGADYTTGPFQFGASYLNQDDEADDETDRYTGGVVYTLTQGLTLRGSISYSDIDTAGAESDATSVLGGGQFNF